MRRPGSMDLLMHHMAQTQPAIGQTMGAFLHLQGTPPPLEALRKHVHAHLHRLPRLTHYLHGPGLKARWQHDPEPDLRIRVRHHVVPAGDDGLAAAVSDLTTRPLPDRGPLWDLWLITGHAPDRYTLCCRAHHSTQDGMGMLNTLLTLFGTPPPSSPLPKSRPSVGTYLQTIRDTLAATAPTGVWDDPLHPLSGRRASTWAELPTEQLRTAALPRRGDTNDAFLAVLSGALRTWSTEHWPQGRGRPLPATSMVNLRRPEERDVPGNLFTFAAAPLPSHLPEFDARLDHVIATTRSTKDPARQTALRDLMDRTPARVFRALATRLTTPERAAITTSYVAVHRPLAFRGDPVVAVQPFDWLPHNQPACVVACSYNGMTSVYFATDAALPGLDRLSALFLEEADRSPTAAAAPEAPAVAPVPATMADQTHPPTVDFPFVKAILVDYAGLPAEAITPDAGQADAGIDSMAHTVLSMALEDRLGLDVTERELAEQPTVDALVGFLARRSAERTP